jgi:hypothetical protein
MRGKTWFAGAWVALGILLLAPGFARAVATITIDDATVEDSITLTWSGFDAFCAIPLPAVCGSAGTRRVSESTPTPQIAWDAFFPTTGTFSDGEVDVTFFERDGTTLSDFLQLGFSNTAFDTPTCPAPCVHFTGSFSSDFNDDLAGDFQGPHRTHNEADGPFVFDEFAGFLATVSSDVEPASTVPEPGTLLLLLVGSGFAGVSSWVRKRG